VKLGTVWPSLAKQLPVWLVHLDRPASADKAMALARPPVLPDKPVQTPLETVDRREPLVPPDTTVPPGKPARSALALECRPVLSTRQHLAMLEKLALVLQLAPVHRTASLARRDREVPLARQPVRLDRPGTTAPVRQLDPALLASTGKSKPRN